MPTFDILAAKQAGYTDTEIADFMGSKFGFDAKAAREAGYSDGEIIGQMSQKVSVEGTPASDPLAGTGRPMFGGNGPRSTMGIASEPDRSLAERATGFIKDTAIDAAKGVVGLGESVVGLADIVTGNLAGKGLATVGYDPVASKKTLESGYSPERMVANQNVQNAEGFMATLGALVDNPSVAFGSIVESAPLSIGSAAAARAVALRMLATAGIAPGTAAATKFFANPRTQAALLAASAGAEGLTTSGSIQEQGRQSGRGYTQTVGPALAAGAGTAAISALSSKIPGFHDAESTAALTGIGGTAKGNALASAKEIAKGMFKEGVLEELPQSAQEQIFTNIAMGKPWSEGVSAAAAQGMVAGAGQGGGMVASSEIGNRSPYAKTGDAITDGMDFAPEQADQTAMLATMHPERREVFLKKQRIADERERLQAMRKPADVTVPDVGITDEAVSVDDAIKAANAEVASAGEWDQASRADLLSKLGGEEVAPEPVATAEAQPVIPTEAQAAQELGVQPEAPIVPALQGGEDVALNQQETAPPDGSSSAQPGGGAVNGDTAVGGEGIRPGGPAQRIEAGDDTRPVGAAQEAVAAPAPESVPQSAIPTISREDAIAAKQQVVAELAQVKPDSDRAAQLQVQLDQYNQIIGGEAQYRDFQPAVSEVQPKTQPADLPRAETVTAPVQAEASPLSPMAQKAKALAGPRPKPAPIAESAAKAAEWVPASPDTTRTILNRLANPKRLKDRMVQGLAIDHGKDAVNALVKQGLVRFPGQGKAEITKQGEAWLKDNPAPRTPAQQERMRMLEGKRKRTEKDEAALAGLRALGEPVGNATAPQASVAEPDTATQTSLTPAAIQRVQDLITQALPAGKVDLRIVDSINPNIPGMEEAFAAHGVTMAKVQGLHTSERTISTGEVRSIITLAMDGATERTGYHECLHAAEAMNLLSPQDIRILEREFPTQDGVDSSERRADAFADFMENGTRPKGYAQVLFGRIAKFLERLRGLLAGRGWRTAEDVFRGLASGEMKSVFASGSDTGREPKAFPQVSKGQPIISQKVGNVSSTAAQNFSDFIESPAFLDVLDNIIKDKGLLDASSRSAQNSVSSEASSEKGPTDNPLADTKFMSNILHSEAFRQQGYGGLNVKTQEVMLKHVFRAGQDNEVANIIVGLIPVDVMNNLFGKKLTPDMVLHNPAMVQSRLISAARDGITLPVDAANSTARVSALVRAIESAGLAGSDLVREFVNNGSTDATFNIGHIESSLKRLLDDTRYNRTSQVDSKFSVQGDLPQETRMQYLAKRFQDRYNRVKILQDWLKKQGIQLSELADASRGLNTYLGRVADQLKRFMDLGVQPLVKEAGKARISLGDIERYLLMQHAAEANAAMQKLHNDPTALAFGVTDAEAAKELATYRSRPDFNTLKQIADKFQAFSTETADMLLNAGIITQEMRDAWDGAYKHYVPLRGGDEDTRQGTGKGLRVNAKQQRRSGHGLRDEHVIENIIKARERAIKTIEKNNVALSVAALIHEADDDRIGTIGKPEKRRVFGRQRSYTVMFQGQPVAAFTNESDADAYVTKDRLTSKAPLSDYVLNISSDPTVSWMTSPMLGNNEINAYINGHQVRIQINDQVAADALTNMGAEGLNTLLAAGKQINNYLSRAYTGYDPRFTIRNTFRDFTAGMVNLTGDYGAGTAAKIAMNYPKAVAEFIKARKDPTASTWVDRYRKQGGSTGASWLPSIERLGEDVQAMYQEQIGSIATYQQVYADQIAKGKSAMAAHVKATARAGLAGVHKAPIMGHFLKLIEAMNAVSENAFRLSTFMTLVEEGKSEAEAGEAAKGSTINFDKRGEIGAQMGALWLFFNPAVQGIQRTVYALSQSEHKHQAQALVGSMALVGFLAAEWARSMGGGDDDEWDKIPRHVKNRNLVIRTGEKTQITLPLPYEYGSFVGIGYAMSDALHGKMDKRAGLNLAGSMLDGWMPLGNPITDKGDFQALALLPTVPKMAIAPNTNLNSFGNPIAPEKYGRDYIPDSQNMYRTTRGTVYAKAAEAMNEATGGSKYTAGAVDVSPEMIKFYTRSLLPGGVFFVSDVVGLGNILAHGEAPEISEVPMASILARENTVRDTQSQFYEIAADAKAAAGEVSLAKKNRDFDAARALKQDKAVLLSVAKVAETQKKLAKAKRDAIDAVRLDDSLSFGEKRAKTKELEQKEEQIYNVLIRKFEQRSSASQD